MDDSETFFQHNIHFFQLHSPNSYNFAPKMDNTVKPQNYTASISLKNILKL